MAFALKGLAAILSSALNASTGSISCSQVTGSLSNAVDLVCPSCRNGSLQEQVSQSPPAVALAGANLEVVNKFCYLGDMLDAGGGIESSSITPVN